ncbi:MAG TPA: S8 family serine peptidase [Gammaproteobacteria bacterium]|nr:S8 family serine peptidase [Gammaproteobacteria bacterium]
MRLLSYAALAAFSAASVGLAQAATAAAPPAGLLAHPLPRSAAPAPSGAKNRYIVRFQDAPVPLRGSAARSPKTATSADNMRRPQVYAASAAAYARYLKTRHVEFLQHARRTLKRTLKPHFRYRYALNGMSVSLTATEAAKLATLPNVASVEPVRYFKPTASIPATQADTGASRAWIGAPEIWPLPTTDTGAGLDTEGEGIVVASLDTGINSGNASFAATGLDGYTTRNPLGSGQYLGVCDPANADQAPKKPAFFNCNSKLIGAYTYTGDDNDPNSPEDSQSHGSHTASTIAGNLVEVDMNGATLPLSGIAPHSNIIVYDVCDPVEFCPTDASVAAVNQAIKDYSRLSAMPGFKGMVLNFSVGGGAFPYANPVSQAFLAAVEAGIYVSASAGNGGPVSTIADDNTLVYPVEHLGPWVATMAASTHDGTFENTLTLNGGASPPGPLIGTGVTGPLSAAPIVYAGDYGYGAGYDYRAHLDPDAIYGPSSAPTTPAEIAQAERECQFPFPPGTFVPGSIVVCDRGTIARAQKAINISYDWSAHPDGNYSAGTAGGAGFVLANSADMDTLFNNAFAVPGVQLVYADGQALKDWLAANPGSGGAASPTNPPNAALVAEIGGAAAAHDPGQADYVAGFSSRGPVGDIYDNLLKPDLTAPGANVLAAISNPAYIDGATGGANEPDTYAFESGTSMAAPHGAGAAALLMQLHPQWTPAEVKSALMLTAATSLGDLCAELDSDNGCVQSDAAPSPQVRGSGRIDVRLASRTGIVMDETASGYKAANPADYGDLTTLNLPSLADNDCVLTCRWTRTFESALNSATASYTISVSGVTEGLTVSTDPESFTLAPGATRTVTFTAKVDALPVKQWAFAQINLLTTDSGDDGQPVPGMHLPLAVEPQPPMPTMVVSPARLDLSVQEGETVSATLNIADIGPGDLNWQFATSGQSGTVDVWDQPYKGATSGVPSGVYTDDGHGIYSADHFSMPAKGTITKIFTDGFAQTMDQQLVSLETDASAIDWYIYADARGQPAGNPEDDQSYYIWHYHSAPTGTGIDTTAGVLQSGIVLDLAAAGQAPVELDAGKYWLVVDVTFNASYSDSDAPAWYWLLSEELDNDHAPDGALVLDPGDLAGQGYEIYTAGGSLAFTLTGTFDCSGAGLAGLSFSEQSGAIKAGTDADVDVTFDAATAEPGLYSAPVCIAGNDPENPVASVPVSVTVTRAPESQDTPAPSSGGSGGGGGAVGWFALLLCVAAGGVRLNGRREEKQV